MEVNGIGDSGWSESPKANAGWGLVTKPDRLEFVLAFGLAAPQARRTFGLTLAPVYFES